MGDKSVEIPPTPTPIPPSGGIDNRQEIINQKLYENELLKDPQPKSKPEFITTNINDYYYYYRGGRSRRSSAKKRASRRKPRSTKKGATRRYRRRRA